MKNKDKLVSIAMATYNGEKYIREQLDSILNQTYENLEVVICDDNSIDNTFKILQEYAKKDSRIKLYRNKNNLGFVKNFEEAISLCNGDYIALSDQDDIWMENKIEILLNEIGNKLLIHSDMELIDEKGKKINKIWDKCDKQIYEFKFFVFRNVVTGCTMMFSKQLIKEILPIPSKEFFHDWWIALIASKRNGIKFVNKPLIQYRQHSNQIVGAAKNKNNLLYKLKNLFMYYFDKKNTKRYKYANAQILRLKSILVERDDILNANEQKVIKEAIEYYGDYLNKLVHFKRFFYGIKYNKYIYCKNPLFIRNIIFDLIG